MEYGGSYNFIHHFHETLIFRILNLNIDTITE